MRDDQRTSGRIHRPMAGQGGFLLTGLVIRTALAVVVLAIAINDGGQLVAAQVKAESVARAAATAGADTWYRTHRGDLAKQDAMTAAAQTDPNTKVISIDIDQSEGTVTVRVEKQARTLVVKRVGFLKRYVAQGATDTEVRTA